MGQGFAAVATAVALVAASGSACAMSSPGRESPHCRVIGGEKLPAETGGTSALCAAIERAVAARSPGVAYSIEVRVLSNWRLAGTVTTAEGRALPTVNHAISDRSLSKASVDRFAAAVAAEIGKTVQR